MKKKIRITAIVLSAILLSACSEKAIKLPKEESSSKAETTAATTTTTASSTQSESKPETSQIQTEERPEIKPPEEKPEIKPPAEAGIAGFEWDHRPYLDAEDVIVPLTYVNDADDSPNWYVIKLNDGTYGIEGDGLKLETFTNAKSDDKPETPYSEYGFENVVFCPLHGITMSYYGSGESPLSAVITGNGKSCEVSKEYLQEGHGLASDKDKELLVNYSKNHNSLWYADFVTNNEITEYTKEEAKDRLFFARECEYTGKDADDKNIGTPGDKFALFNGYEQITDFIFDEFKAPNADDVIFVEENTVYYSKVDYPLAVKQNGRYFYINKDGKRVNDADYEDAYAFTQGLAVVKNENGYGYIDVNGREVIPAGTFENAKYVCDGAAWVKYEGKWGIIRFRQSKIPCLQRDSQAEVAYTGKLISKKDKDGEKTLYYLTPDKQPMYYKFMYINMVSIFQPVLNEIKEIVISTDENYDDLVGKTVDFTGMIRAYCPTPENEKAYPTNPYLIADKLELAE